MLEESWLLALFKLDFTKIVLGSVTTLAGVFFTSHLAQRRQDKQVKQQRMESVGQSLSRVLQAAHDIKEEIFNTHTGEEQILFKWSIYSTLVRPALFEHYIWLPETIQQSITRLDEIARFKRISDNLGMFKDYNEKMNHEFDILVDLIHKFMQQHLNHLQ